MAEYTDAFVEDAIKLRIEEPDANGYAAFTILVNNMPYKFIPDGPTFRAILRELQTINTVIRG